MLMSVYCKVIYMEGKWPARWLPPVAGVAVMLALAVLRLVR